MPPSALDRCPGCCALLPAVDGPTHRYIGASSACWVLFADLVNGGEQPLALSPFNDLIQDAYAAQHPGTPSPQAVQSVAVHLLLLFGIFEREVAPANALRIRLQAVQDGRISV